jgi:hypothetical protein
MPWALGLAATRHLLLHGGGRAQDGYGQRSTYREGWDARPEGGIAHDAVAPALTAQGPREIRRRQSPGINLQVAGRFDTHEAWRHVLQELGGTSSAPRPIRRSEEAAEREVSRIIRAMPFVWLAVDDAPGPASLRGVYREKQACRRTSPRRPSRLARGDPDHLALADGAEL